MKSPRSTRLLWMVVILILSLSCSIDMGTTPTEAPVAIPPTAIAQATAIPPTPIPIPTETPIPPTAVPTKGPIIIDDDFSSDTGRFKCESCFFDGESLTIGPFPLVDSYKPFVVLCGDCGSPPNYKMSVETWFAAGSQPLGFGLVVRQDKKYTYLVAMSSWQVYNVFEFDETAGGGVGYRSLVGNWSKGGLGPGRAVHFIDILMMNGSMTLTINKDFSRVFDLPSGSGEVGLSVGNWETSASFDNFHYEELP